MDIVDRLRASKFPGWAKLAEEAATEIETLRARQFVPTNTIYSAAVFLAKNGNFHAGYWLPAKVEIDTSEDAVLGSLLNECRKNNPDYLPVTWNTWSVPVSLPLPESATDDPEEEKPE